MAFFGNRRFGGVPPCRPDGGTIMTDASPVPTGKLTNRSLHDRVCDVLDQVRPFIRGDGGDIELIDVDDSGVVRVRLHGACIGCPSSAITLALGIERNLRDQVPEVTRVVCA